MEDKKLNEVTTVNSGTLANVKTFLAVMKDGTIQQMSKEDLASVVGGLIGTADNTKDGLVSSLFAPIKVDDPYPSGPGYIRIKKKIGLSFFFEFFGNGTHPNLYYIALDLSETDNKSIANIKKIAEFVQVNSLYAKEDSQYIYLSKLYGARLKVSLIPVSGNSNIEWDIIATSLLPSDATNIQVL